MIEADDAPVFDRESDAVADGQGSDDDMIIAAGEPGRVRNDGFVLMYGLCGGRFGGRDELFCRLAAAVEDLIEPSLKNDSISMN